MKQVLKSLDEEPSDKGSDSHKFARQTEGADEGGPEAEEGDQWVR